MAGEYQDLFAESGENEFDLFETEINSLNTRVDSVETQVKVIQGEWKDGLKEEILWGVGQQTTSLNTRVDDMKTQVANLKEEILSEVDKKIESLREEMTAG